MSYSAQSAFLATLVEEAQVDVVRLRVYQPLNYIYQERAYE